MKATSQFGVEYDSLADIVSFGVAPAFLLYGFALRDLGRPAWFAAFLFVICGGLRLARFNVFTGSIDKRFFVGLPIPAAAAVVCGTVIFLHDEELTRWMRGAIAVMTYLVALLMVSTFRYWSFKEVDWARRRPVQTLLIVVLAVMIVATKHEVFLFLVFAGYAVSGPVWRVVGGRTPAVGGVADAPGREHS
jgi:CDP-diacylglycerol--serine O-phosphatidyltransferase